MDTDKKEWSLSNPPPKGHADVADFAANLFDISSREIERLGKHADMLANYSLYRRKSNEVTGRSPGTTPVNLYFANIERTVANITAREPMGEVKDLDGTEEDNAEAALSSKLKKWWGESKEQVKIRITARQMEIYGVTFEKPSWLKDEGRPMIAITDPFCAYPAPGYYENIDTDMPFFCFAYLQYVDEVEKKFGVTGIVPDEAYELLGIVREEYKNTSGYSGLNTSLTGRYTEPTIKRGGAASTVSDKKIEQCLVKEVWIRDFTTRTEITEREVANPYTGEPMRDERGLPVTERIKKEIQIYPDGVRKITIVESKDAKHNPNNNRSNHVVIDDSANPNINPKLPVELAATTHPWGRFPAYHANSYADLMSVWGFSAAEQVGDLLININRIINKLVQYVLQVMAPPLIVQKNCGITREMITSQFKKLGRLILMPTTPNARIEFLQIPNLPATFFQVLELLVSFFDRIYAIESADRGQAPSGVVAASAIVALQERNQQLTQAKVAAIESIVENRSRWCIGLYQNFGVDTDLVDVNGDPLPFTGVNYAGRKFGYVIESGSTTPMTSLQVQEQAAKLYEVGAIDRQALLEAINFPGWKEIVERIGEGQLNQALQVLIAAGLDEAIALELKNHLLEPNQGPGGSNINKNPKPGTPKSKQEA